MVFKLVSQYTFTTNYLAGREECMKECLKRETGLDTQAIEEIVACLATSGLDYWRLAGCIGLSLLRRSWRAIQKCWGECSYYEFSPTTVPGACFYITSDGQRHCRNVRGEVYCNQIKNSPNVVFAEFYPLRQCASPYSL